MPTPTPTTASPTPSPTESGPAGTPFFTDDFSTGDLSKWSSVSGLSVSGGEAVATSTGTVTYARRTMASRSELFLRARVQVVSQGRTLACLLKVRASTAVADVCLDVDGTVYSWNYVTRFKSVSSTRIRPGTGWHDVQMRAVVAGESSVVEIWVDGVKVEMPDGGSLGVAPLTSFQLGGNESSKAYDLRFDDVVASDGYIS